MSETQKDTSQASLTFDESTIVSVAPVAKKQMSIGTFSRPAVKGTHRDFVLNPLGQDVTKYDGWFPQGDVSAVGGSSGTGKTTFMIGLLCNQKNGEKVFGHTTRGLSFLVMMADRGTNANLRTIERMGINPDEVPIKRLKGQGQSALSSIKEGIESCAEIPQIVFIEGADMLLEEPNMINVVSPFITELQELARHYHIALIVSLGSPKMSSKDFYTIRRDQLFGSVAWGRMTESVIVLGYGDDDTTAARSAAVLLRNGASEKLALIFEHGKLIVDTTQGIDTLAAWVLEQTEWFTIQTMSEGTDQTIDICRKKMKTFLTWKGAGQIDTKVVGKTHTKHYLLHSATSAPALETGEMIETGETL